VTKSNKSKNSHQELEDFLSGLGNFGKILAIGEESSLWLEVMLSQNKDINFYHTKDFEGFSKLYSKEIFDLVICLNFIGGKNKSDDSERISELCKSSRLIVFSSPSPIRVNAYQLNHWPSYWVDIFTNLQFFTSTYGRSILWENKLISASIIQELLVCSRDSNVLRSDIPFDVIHPESIFLLNFEKKKNRFLRILNKFILKNTPYFFIRIAKTILPIELRKKIKDWFLT
jgi:hypothetical protein